MKRLMFAAAALYGSYWYVSRHFEFADTLTIAKKHPNASWAPGMDYWVGVIYYQRSEYAKAQEAFTQLVTDYSTGTYTAKGLQRLSLAAEENRDWPVARQSIERFIEEFPDHKDRRAAEQRLEILKFK